MKRFISRLLVLFLFASVLGAETYHSLSPSSKKEIDSKRGNITVRCNVSGAEVYINRHYHGRTPLTIEGLSAGTYDLEVRSSNYETGFYRITVRSGYSYSYDVSLKKITGHISLSNVPSDAEIYIDGNRRYSTYQEVDVGDHTVKIRRFGYEDFYKSVYVYARDVVNVYASFIPANFRLSNFDVSRTKINPERSGAISRCEFTFEVTTNGSADLEIFNAAGQKIWGHTFAGFSTWNNAIYWYGTDEYGNTVPDGAYKAIITAEQYSYYIIINVDSALAYPMIAVTPSGGGIGTLPMAYHSDTGFVVPFISFEPNISLNENESPLLASPITGGVLFGFGSWGELGGSISAYLKSGMDSPAISANAVFRGTLGFELEYHEYLNVTLLLRYGMSTVERFPPYGVDTGNGLGFGLVVGYDSQNCYFGGSSEFIAGPENGNVALESYVLKSGLAAMFKPIPSISLGGWTALHSAFGLYTDKMTVATPETIWTRAVEGGFEFKLMPSSASVMMDGNVKALYIMDDDIYITAKFGLSYFF